MENNTNIFESLLESATDYGKLSYELVKLKILDKMADVVSSFIPHLVTIVIIISFSILLNIGFAFWLGEILGKIYYGFFVVAAVNVLGGIAFHRLLYKWIKRVACDYIIKEVLK